MYSLESRRTVVMSEAAALELIDSEDSRGYEQPPVADSVPRHLVLQLTIPKALLRMGMQMGGSLERGQSTSARLMRTVEHFVSVISRYCNLQPNASCDARADLLLCDAFYWSRADSGSTYLYECHCVCLVAITNDVEFCFKALFNAACVMFNLRWPLSRRQFPLAVMQRTFAYSSEPLHFARGREPLSRGNPQSGYMIRSPVTQHHSFEQSEALDRVYFRDFFHSPMLVSFPEPMPANLSVHDWAIRLLKPELDLEWRVLVPGGDASKTDVQQLLDSRVGLTQEQQRGISKLLGLDLPFRAICMETSFFLRLFKPPAATAQPPAQAPQPQPQQSHSLRVPAPMQREPPQTPSSGRSPRARSPSSSQSQQSKRARQEINLDPPPEIVYDSDNDSSVEEILPRIEIGFEPTNRAERAFARQVEQYEIERRQRPRSTLRRALADAQSRSAQSAQQIEAQQLATQGSTDVRPSAPRTVRFTTGTAAAQPKNGFV